MIWRYEERLPSQGTLRRLAATDGAWGIVRKSVHGVVQVGQGEPIPGRKATEFRSLAATIADAHPQPWVGRYALENGREWLIAVHDEHGILPDGDRVGTPEEIDQVIEGFGSESEWNQVTGGIDDLVDLVRAARKTPPLQDLTASVWRRWAIPAAGVSVVALAGGIGLFLHARQAELAEQERIASIRALQQRQAAAAKAARMALPWATESSSNSVIAACGRKWETQDFERDGWVVSTWGCVSNRGRVNVTVGWNRAGGLAADAPGVLDAGGDRSTEVLDDFALPPTVAGTALTQSDARRAIWTFAQKNSLKLTLTGGEQPKLPGAPALDTSAPMWGVTNVTLETYAPPWLLGADFDEVPAMRVNGTSFDFQTQQWRVEATMYSSSETASPISKAGV
ncbi:hypothetical protein WS58_16585 [Burkholderia pseudomultivorans]|nr:hypothetical protein WS57_35090 [Burkholderia pseudomultivorans]KVC27780.1 hypothetical protein WS55_12955 [Burkholderia pseudomultivorans]KVC36902.1 hypothetical protein WS56_00325 [Burkholderia pseudomultivorans]KVC42143.1 hypothetical protein WS58_16585 [Burkholderia pseudomultivorans]